MMNIQPAFFDGGGIYTMRICIGLHKTVEYVRNIC